MPYIPEQGDIIWLSFDPSSGKEIMKRKPAYVFSRKIFNEHTGLVIIAPISSTIKGIKLEVVLPDRLETKRAVLVHHPYLHIPELPDDDLGEPGKFP